MFEPRDLLDKVLASPELTRNFLIIGGLVIAAFLLKEFSRRPRKRRQKPNFTVVGAAPDQWNLRDPKVQMEAISAAQFAPQPILNKEEYRLLPILEDIVRNLDRGYRVVIQTSLGEVLNARGKTKDIQRNAYSSINSKRLDFGIINAAGILCLAIEYQGSGHHNNRTFMRDAVKREALRKAGIHMLEVRKGFTPDQIRGEILTLLDDTGPGRP